MIYAIREFFVEGGWCAAALASLSAVLYFFIAERFFTTIEHFRTIKSGKEISPEVFEISGLRRMSFIRAGIIAAPLLGLLGTVTGMVDVFNKICQGGYVVGMSGGISKALLTTQYGLIIAIPALIAEKILLNLKQKTISMSRAAITSGEAR